MTTAAALPTREGYPSLRAAWAPLLALCLTFLVEMLDNTVLNIALPTISRDLHAGATDLQWVTGAYSLTFGGLLLVFGRLADRIGRRQVLLVGLVLFGGLSALVLLVRTPGELIGLRALLGLSAALIAPVSMSLAFRLFTDERLRMRAITIISTVGICGFALGPVVAGSVIATLPWQVLLMVNVPVAAAAWFGVSRGIERDRPEELHRDPVDVLGAVLSVVALTASIYVFTSGVERGWSSAVTLAVAAAAVLSVGGFVVRLLRAEHPMIDWHLLRNGTFRGGAITQTATMLAMSGGLFVLTLHLQLVWGWSPLRAALGTAPVAVTMILMAPLVDRVVATLGHRRTVLVGGLAAAVALVLMSVGLRSGYLTIAAALVLMTAGIRLVMTTSAVALVEAMPQDQTSLGSAVNDTAQELGSSIGTAVMGTMIAAAAGVGIPSVTVGSAWAQDLVRAESHAQLVVAALVAGLTLYGGRMLTDSRVTDEH